MLWVLGRCFLPLHLPSSGTGLQASSSALHAEQSPASAPVRDSPERSFEYYTWALHSSDIPFFGVGTASSNLCLERQLAYTVGSWLHAQFLDAALAVDLNKLDDLLAGLWQTLFRLVNGWIHFEKAPLYDTVAIAGKTARLSSNSSHKAQTALIRWLATHQLKLPDELNLAPLQIGSLTPGQASAAALSGIRGHGLMIQPGRQSSFRVSMLAKMPPIACPTHDLNTAYVIGYAASVCFPCNTKEPSLPGLSIVLRPWVRTAEQAPMRPTLADAISDARSGSARYLAVGQHLHRLVCSHRPRVLDPTEESPVASSTASYAILSRLRWFIRGYDNEDVKDQIDILSKPVRTSLRKLNVA
jgi:hypothetical protein